MVTFPTTQGLPITSRYGYRGDIGVPGASHWHWAIDIGGGTTNHPIYATQSGIVRDNRWTDGGGWGIVLEHTGDSYWSKYIHLSVRSPIEIGTSVLEGQVIGTMGTTGISSGIHLDFSVSTNNTWGFDTDPQGTVDPELYLQGASDPPTTDLPEQIGGNRYLNRQEMENNATIIWYHLMQNGWTMQSVAGMLGNMESESTINPEIWQDLATGRLDLGYGLVQWTPATKYIEWAISQSLDQTRIESQLARLEYEIENGLQWIATTAYPMSFQEFKQSTASPYDLGIAFLLNYERPADQNQPNRGTQAEIWFQFLQTLDFSDGGSSGQSDDLIVLWLSGALNGFNGF